ncbi:oxygen-independent coproporphyrinogen III oxidase [Nodosilinea sp. E11]|uniref:oxygen-independent coproporphyrinogen III oxidase n=1 Tax=Nodosilinea sp. E11 TaxID=3037479 RepID=UPI00293490F1|nr:oxygen-independent coproporphyrinogen III oxidase [Nodosilinea sp. E11]WOD39460.1 oxygen-independent coproporphyrinogen III oxidase [Nodosilinea sp. E11]
MLSVTNPVVFDSALLHKYNQPLPRYTSYPPATEMREDLGLREVEAAIAVGNYKQTPLSLYCHIPFCESACYFCGCNTVITRQKQVADPYLDYLERNIAQVAQRVQHRRVNQLHWGGGTPSYLTIAQVERLWNVLHQHFEFEPGAEISIEVNPRDLDRDYVTFLKELGFKRVSFGLQDFNLKVQAAVNRIQPEAMLFDAMGWLREAGFESVNVDLIYGLPYQTLETFRDTIEKTLRLDPDRIAVFNFAYVPWLKPIQKKHIDPATLPGPEAKLNIFHMTIDRLTAAGYQFIGMDHFAKAGDELAIAQAQGQLHRNFQGYTTQPESDLLGFGMTSITMLHDVYAQNHKGLRDFYTAVDAGTLPLERAVVLSQDDILRRAVIMELMCQFELSKAAIEEKYHLSFDQSFDDYFARERQDLQALAADGLVRLTPNHIEVLPAGRLLIRNIAAVFDTYLRNRTLRQFSQSV